MRGYGSFNASMSNRTIALAMLVLSLLVAAPGAPGAFEVTSVNLHLHLSGLKKAEAPRIMEEHLVLSVSGPYRFVGAAFSHESWTQVHPFEINRYNIFVLAIPLPYGDATTVRYRLVLDGLWAADPSNPVAERDSSTGAALSLASLPARPRTVLGVWNPAHENGATFYFEAEPGQLITVAGTFNGWDPFIHEMTEILPGRYELQLVLQPGQYYYVFFYKGERLADPLNQELRYTMDGRAVSALVIPAGG